MATKINLRFLVTGLGFISCLHLSLLFPISAESQAPGLTTADAYPQQTESIGRLSVGDIAPDFILPSISGRPVTLSQFRDNKNVVLTFIPAAWTPVCSGQWPIYHNAQSSFEGLDTIILGISTDNAPTLSSWTDALGGMWFPVLSDFWPHGFVAEQYGVLRRDGMAERAIFVIDKKGFIRYIDIHDIGSIPPVDVLQSVLKDL
jgi:peroxiredoxin